MKNRRSIAVVAGEVSPPEYQPMVSDRIIPRLLAHPIPSHRLVWVPLSISQGSKPGRDSGFTVQSGQRMLPHKISILCQKLHHLFPLQITVMSAKYIWTYMEEPCQLYSENYTVAHFLWCIFEYSRESRVFSHSVNNCMELEMPHKSLNFDLQWRLGCSNSLL